MLTPHAAVGEDFSRSSGAACEWAPGTRRLRRPCLEFPTQRDHVLSTCLNAQAQLAQRVLQHGLIDARSSASKSAKEMLSILEKASRWLRGEEKPGTTAAREWGELTTAYDEALDGRPDTLMKVLSAPGRRQVEQLALEGPVGSEQDD